MASHTPTVATWRVPELSAALELLKPITWFAPMWAYMCGVVSAGSIDAARWPEAIAGAILAGPLVCGMSQAVNDWYDRHVDAINEPDRPIPSGRVPGRWGLAIACGMTGLALASAAMLGAVVLAASAGGIAVAWAYSAPPVRLKRNGWISGTICGACYEGLPWFTGAAAASGAMPSHAVIVIAALYSIGAFGIMTLNDFKSVEGDRRLGLLSVPVHIGIPNAALVACAFMGLPQAGAIAALWMWGKPAHAAAIGLLLAVQIVLMRRLLLAPLERAPWYNATGTTLFVTGMLISAFAIRTLT